MTSKVLVIVPFAMSADNLLLREQQLQGLQFGPDIEFEYRPVTAGPVNYSSHHDFVLADVANFEAGCRAQAEGYAAVCIDTMSDSGVAALRSVLDIPVFGPGKVSMLTALMLGEVFQEVGLPPGVCTTSAPRCVRSRCRRTTRPCWRARRNWCFRCSSALHARRLTRMAPTC